MFVARNPSPIKLFFAVVANLKGFLLWATRQIGKAIRIHLIGRSFALLNGSRAVMGAITGSRAILVGMMWARLFGDSTKVFFTAIVTCFWFVALMRQSSSPYLAHTFGGGAAKIGQTIWFDKSFVVVRMMIAAFHDLQIAFAVVIANTVDMVNNLIVSNSTAQYAAHHQNMLADIPALVSVRMARLHNKDIASSGGIHAALLVPRTFRSSHRNTSFFSAMIVANMKEVFNGH